MHENSAHPGYVLDAPYPDTFFRELSPAWLNYVARLNGTRVRALDAPFTYLELGCGLGNTVITNAGAFPHGRFHACDLNRAHVEHARGRARAFGVENVEFHQSSFEELGHAELPMFDFIVAHGVYSWVSAHDRQAIRHLARDLLKPAGLLYVSYNSLPGWACEAPLRKLLVELAASEPVDTTTRATRALQSLQALKTRRLRYLEANPACTEAIGVYAGAPMSYLAHEFLNESWEPFYCVDVADQMHEARVHYLGTATLVENHPELLVDEATLESIGGLATQRQRRLAMDFATNQQFRRDVFCRGADLVPERPRMDAQVIGCAASAGRLPREVRVPRGVIRFQETFVRRLQALLANGPLTIGAAVSGLGAADAREVEESRRNLLYLVAGGALTPFARALSPADAPWPGEAQRSPGDAPPANETIARILRHSIEHDAPAVLPSELMGNGLRITSVEAASVMAWLQGDPRASAGLVSRLLHAGILR